MRVVFIQTGMKIANALAKDPYHVHIFKTELNLEFKFVFVYTYVE